MEWNQLFPKKEDWQRTTFDRIKRDLISAKDNRVIRYDNAQEDHLVMIYGESQVGKTTLILNMIGLKDACFPEVYETLRAGISKGNSSTSTAIIYSKSVNEKYGCALASVNDLSTRKTEYFDKKGMVRYLQKIREQVESNRLGTDNVLFVYIPSSYFVPDPAANSISIMDMPGTRSRNHKEDMHVQSLMAKYIPVSSVCIIACRSNEIQSLEAMVLPNQLDWKRMDHRFILVITHAYSDETTRNYFKVPASKRKKPFYEDVREEYTQEIRKILGSNNQTEVYPVDVGDSLAMLCSKEIERENDRKEIIAAKNRILSDLRGSIVKHKGDRLKSALLDLDVIVKNYGRAELRYIAEEISTSNDRIRHREQLIKRAEEYRRQLSGDGSEKAEIKMEIRHLQKTRSELARLLSGCISGLPGQAKQYIEERALYKYSGGEKYLKDKEESLIAYLRTSISEETERYIERFSKLVGQADIGVAVNISEIRSRIDSECVLAKKDDLYPPQKGFFSKREKVSICRVESTCGTMQKNINEMLNGCVNAYISKVNGVIKKREGRVRSIDRSISAQTSVIEKYKGEIQSFRQGIKELHRQREDIERKRKQDQETLAMYLSYADSAYAEQRREVIRQINRSRLADDKILLILFLGLLDKDYHKITGGIHEDSYQYAVAK